MLKYFLILLSLIASLKINSQDTLVLKLNPKFKVVNEKKATITRQVIKSDSIYLIKDFSKSNVLLMTSECSKYDPMIENGKSAYYNDDGSKIGEGNYKNGLMFGKWILHTKGKADTIDYTKAYEYYINIDKVESLTALNKCDEMPLFKGSSDLKKFINYVENRVYYPPRSIYYLKTAKVEIQFTVDNMGKVVNPKILSPIDKDMELESIRVLLKSPKWTPGKNNGDLVNVNFKRVCNYIVLCKNVWGLDRMFQNHYFDRT